MKGRVLPTLVGVVIGSFLGQWFFWSIFQDAVGWWPFWIAFAVGCVLTLPGALFFDAVHEEAEYIADRNEEDLEQLAEELREVDRMAEEMVRESNSRATTINVDARSVHYHNETDGPEKPHSKIKP